MLLKLLSVCLGEILILSVLCNGYPKKHSEHGLNEQVSVKENVVFADTGVDIVDTSVDITDSSDMERTFMTGKKLQDGIEVQVDETYDEDVRRFKRSFNITEIHNGGAILDEPINYKESEINHLIAGMIIENKGQTMKPDIRPWMNDKQKYEVKDIHKLTHKQKVMMGIESERPGEFLDKRRKKRNFFWDDDYLWPGGIVPYVVDSSISVQSEALIKQAISLMADVTCIKFVPLGSVSTTHGNSVIFHSGDGCSSYIGMVGGRQQVSLKEPYCATVPVILHEMAHAIGQAHEQSRSDRNNYVQLFFHNIKSGSDNFNMRQFGTRNLNPYDLESILQYGLYSFSVNGEATIHVKDSRLEFLPGSTDTLTFYDIKDITGAYKCTDKCLFPRSCKNGGFLNHKCQCYCPAGLIGNTCDRIETDCGGFIDINHSETISITSPNYPQKYKSGVNCNWIIRGPANTHIEMVMDDFELSHSSSVCYHWLEVRYNLLGQNGPKMCGAATYERFTTTPDEYSNYMYLRFNSAFAADKDPAKGFSLTVRAIGTGCGGNPCKMGKCKDGLRGTYTCNCDPGFSGTYCDVASQADMVLESDFDGKMSMMNNEFGDNFDWTRNFGSTPSNGTGPQSAHSGSYYYYIESSIPRKEGDVANLVSWIKFDQDIDRCLHFYYHMFGEDIEKLSVIVGGSRTSERVVWEKKGAQGQAWNLAEVNIPARSELKISIVGERGKGYQGDIAVDTFRLYPDRCDRVQVMSTTQQTTKQSSATTTPGTTTTNEPFTYNVLESCAFEPRTNCFLENTPSNGNTERQTDSETYFSESSDDFDWTIGFGKTPTSFTGPTSAFEGTNFAYIETSNQLNGKKARLRSRTTFNVRRACVRFYYHMFGDLAIGQLSVYTQNMETGNQRLVFRKRGNRGKRWHLAEIQIYNAASKKLYIEASRGYTQYGDISIDNLQITDGLCRCSNSLCENGGKCATSDTPGSFTCACPPGYSGQYCQETVGAVSCTFTPLTSCFLSQSSQDDFNWLFGMRTPTFNTGPQNIYDGVFAYIQGTGKTPNSKAILTTNGTNLAEQDWCLTMAYNMYGRHVGSLAITSGSPDNIQEITKISGDQGNNWKILSVDIPSTSNLLINIEAERGSGYLSDIAIDSVFLQPGSCQSS